MGVQEQPQPHPLPPAQQPQYDPTLAYQSHHHHHHHHQPEYTQGTQPYQQFPPQVALYGGPGEGGMHDPYRCYPQQWGFVAVQNPYGEQPAAAPAMPQKQEPPVVEPQPEQQPVQPPPPQPPIGEEHAMYMAVHNNLTGEMMKATQGYKESTFKAVTVYLKHVKEIMGDVKCGWNRKYSAAKTIFGKGLTGMTVRSAIHIEHKSLYKGSDVTTGLLRNGKEFLELINQGVSGGNMIFFTYVINLKHELKFSHTGASLLADNLSKHAMHSDANEDVLFSGEFHVIQSGGSPMLIVDNNSGTYAPPKEHLPKIAELFRRNFPGLQVDGWDREDPRLQKSIDSCPSRKGA